MLRRIDGEFEVVAGHRRLAAVQLLGWDGVPAIVRDAADTEAYLLTLIENLQRDGLSPHEESRALEVLLRERRWSTRQVADAIKRSPAYVSKRLRVFEDDTLAPLVLQNKLAVSVAEELLIVPPLQRRRLAQRAIAEAWDRTTLRAETRRPKRPADARRGAGRTKSLLGQLRTLRAMLRDIQFWELEESHRREMRRLFIDLAALGRAPTEKRDAPIFPALPVVTTRR